MFPNQQNRDSWGSVAGYYGNYGMASGLPATVGGSTPGNWYNWTQSGNSSRLSGGWPSGAPYSSPGSSTSPSGARGQGEDSAERSMLASMSGMERDVAEAMARDRELMMRGAQEFGAYSRGGASSSGSKLGINTNIYSFYQNSQNKSGRQPQSNADVTISQVSPQLSSPDYPDHHRPPSGDMRSEKIHPKTSNYNANLHQPSLSPSGFDTSLQKVSNHSQISDNRQSAKGEQEPQNRESVDSNISETLFSACMQEPSSEERAKDVGSTSGNTEAMEPDSSTDNPAESQKQSKESQNKDPLGKNNNGYIQANDDSEDEEPMNEDELKRVEMFKREQMRMFNIKSELEQAQQHSPEMNKRKYFKSPHEDLTDLMKEANEKIFRQTSNHLGGNHHGQLPLSVEIQEMGDNPGDNESVSPPRNVTGRPGFLPNLISNNPLSALSPRKRGRKPKHYSEILFELGQRGISITKTHKPNQVTGRETESVSHKTGGQQLKCPHCNKILTTSVGLMYHIRLHTGEKPYSCDLCGKSFATSSHYHYHIRSHSGEKPYRRNSVKNFRCDFCGKMYTASGSLRLHLKSHLSRLAANAFNTMNIPGFNLGPGSQNGASVPSSMARDPLHVGPADFKFGIKQEVFDHGNTEPQSDANESHNQRRDLENEGPNNNVVETNNNIFCSPQAE